jgi:hypothetical protein
LCHIFCFFVLHYPLFPGFSIHVLPLRQRPRFTPIKNNEDYSFAYSNLCVFTLQVGRQKFWTNWQIPCSDTSPEYGISWVIYRAVTVHSLRAESCTPQTSAAHALARMWWLQVHAAPAGQVPRSTRHAAISHPACLPL